MAASDPSIARTAAALADRRVVAVLDLFLDHAQRHTKPPTYGWYKHFLQDFSDRCGAMKVEELLHLT